jgi:hypothetical protein
MPRLQDFAVGRAVTDAVQGEGFCAAAEQAAGVGYGLAEAGFVVVAEAAGEGAA